MGGRGSNIGGTVFDGGGGRSAAFYDHTDKFRGMSLHDYENVIRNRKQEWIGVADEEGNIVVAGTSGRKGSVAVPTNHPDFNKGYTLTHNHPHDGGRGVGGTLSEADVYNAAELTDKGFGGGTRAVAGGDNEFAYIIKPSQTRKVNPAKLTSYVARVQKNSTMQKRGDKVLKKVEREMKKRGRTMSIEDKNTAYLGGMKSTWRNSKSVYNAGFDYIEVNTPKW